MRNRLNDPISFDFVARQLSSYQLSQALLVIRDKQIYFFNSL